MDWIGIDLDGCLAQWPKDATVQTVCTIGAPIPEMVSFVRELIASGVTVKIFTARVGPATDEECWSASDKRCPTLWDWQEWQTQLIQVWCQEHLGCVLPITATKDFHMIMLYDDRCKQVITNTGKTLEELVGPGMIKALAHTAEFK